EYLALALLQLIDDALYLRDNALHLPVQIRQISLFFERYGAELAVEPTGRIADADTELIDGMMQALGDSVAQQQPTHRRAQTDCQESPSQRLYDALVYPVRFRDLAGVIGSQLLTRQQDFMRQLLRPMFLVAGQLGISDAIAPRPGLEVLAKPFGDL